MTDSVRFLIWEHAVAEDNQVGEKQIVALRECQEHQASRVRKTIRNSFRILQEKHPTTVFSLTEESFVMED